MKLLHEGNGVNPSTFTCVNDYPQDAIISLWISEKNYKQRIYIVNRLVFCGCMKNNQYLMSLSNKHSCFDSLKKMVIGLQ